ncbi:MAG: hypothetical protein AAF789_07075 [Bacteroidota bacterium]
MNKKLILGLLSVGLLSGTYKTHAQQIVVKGGFIEDSLLIGKDFGFYLTAKYPPSLQLFFPDSNASFAPFEYSDKEYFETKLVDNQAYDSTIYYLQSFEIDPVQDFKLSAYLLTGADTTIIATKIDSIYLTELAPVVTDTTSLRTNLAYQEIDTAFNYPMFYIVLGVIGIVLIATILVFGKRILRWFKLKKMQKQYEAFSTELSGYIRRLKEDPEPALAEKALVSWKSYQERLQNRPYLKLTTPEILRQSGTKELADPLRTIDRSIYGNRRQENIYQDFQQIEDFVSHTFQQKVLELKDGK